MSGERAGSEDRMTRDVALIRVPSGAGACGVGQHEASAARQYLRQGFVGVFGHHRRVQQRRGFP